MNIFEYAKKFEKDSELFYRDLANRCFEIGVAVILTRLADEELQHLKAVEAMERGESPTIQDSSILSDMRNIIDMEREKDGIFHEDLPEVEVYTLALEIEQKSGEFYDDCAQKSENAGQKAIFLKLARQEHEHYMTVELMSEFLNGA